MSIWRSKLVKQPTTENTDLIDRINRIKVDVDPIKRKEFLESAHNVFQEPALWQILNELVERQVDHSVRSANSWERVLFDRATLNGFDLIKEELETLEAEFQRNTQPLEQFNKYDVI